MDDHTVPGRKIQTRDWKMRGNLCNVMDMTLNQKQWKRVTMHRSRFTHKILRKHMEPYENTETTKISDQSNTEVQYVIMKLHGKA